MPRTQLWSRFRDQLNDDDEGGALGSKQFGPVLLSHEPTPTFRWFESYVIRS